MQFLKPMSLRPPNGFTTFSINPEDACSFSITTDGISCQVKFRITSNSANMTFSGTDSDTDLKMLSKISAEYIFSHCRDLGQCLPTPGSVILRSDHYSDPDLFHFSAVKQTPSMSDPFKPRNARYERPSYPENKVLYRRFWPGTGKTITLQLASVEHHLEAFHSWQNQDRVNEFWELKGSLSDHKNYLINALKDPHSIPVILFYDEIPAGYFEIYWAWEDRIAPYYQAEPYDRGMHLLIGDTRFLGFPMTYTAWCSVSHFMFLEDSRTNHIVLEPRHDNQKIMKYVNAIDSFKVLKEFEFPHKKAKLICCDRSSFFLGHYL